MIFFGTEHKINKNTKLFNKLNEPSNMSLFEKETSMPYVFVANNAFDLSPHIMKLIPKIHEFCSAYLIPITKIF